MNSTEPTRYSPPPTPLRAWRNIHGLLQRELAELVGLHPATICRIERGQEKPARTTVLALSHVLGVEPDRLFPPEEGE